MADLPEVYPVIGILLLHFQHSCHPTIDCSPGRRQTGGGLVSCSRVAKFLQGAASIQLPPEVAQLSVQGLFAVHSLCAGYCLAFGVLQPYFVSLQLHVLQNLFRLATEKG